MTTCSGKNHSFHPIPRKYLFFSHFIASGHSFVVDLNDKHIYNVETGTCVTKADSSYKQSSYDTTTYKVREVRMRCFKLRNRFRYNYKKTKKSVTSKKQLINKTMNIKMKFVVFTKNPSNVKRIPKMKSTTCKQSSKKQKQTKTTNSFNLVKT
jgi:hypothetical protein